MSRIIKTYNAEVVKRTAKRCKDRGIIIPTFHQMRHPETAPEGIKARLKNVGPLGHRSRQPLPHHMEERP